MLDSPGQRDACAAPGTRRQVLHHSFCLRVGQLAIQTRVEGLAGVSQPPHAPGTRWSPVGFLQSGNHFRCAWVPLVVRDREQRAAAPPDAAHEAFARHVLPEVDVLYRVARSLTRHNADAEDLVQETMLRAFRAIERFDGRHPRAWLLTIMRNANINSTRRKRPVLLDDGDAAFDRSAALADPAAGPEAQVVEAQFDATVEHAYRSLPANFREVIDLVDLGGLSYEQTAAVLEIPQGTVMSRLHRGRARIRAALGDAGARKGVTA